MTALISERTILNPILKWSEIRSWFEESIEISLIVVVLLSTISRMLPLTCVGLSTC